MNGAKEKKTVIKDNVLIHVVNEIINYRDQYERVI